MPASLPSIVTDRDDFYPYPIGKDAAELLLEGAPNYTYLFRESSKDSAVSLSIKEPNKKIEHFQLSVVKKETSITFQCPTATGRVRTYDTLDSFLQEQEQCFKETGVLKQNDRLRKLWEQLNNRQESIPKTVPREIAVLESFYLITERDAAFLLRGERPGTYMLRPCEKKNTVALSIQRGISTRQGVGAGKDNDPPLSTDEVLVPGIIVHSYIEILPGAKGASYSLQYTHRPIGSDYEIINPYRSIENMISDPQFANALKPPSSTRTFKLVPLAYKNALKKLNLDLDLNIPLWRELVTCYLSERVIAVKNTQSKTNTAIAVPGSGTPSRANSPQVNSGIFAPIGTASAATNQTQTTLGRNPTLK